MPGVVNHETLDSGRVIAAPVNYGYSKILQLFYSGVAIAGNNTLDSILVPADYIWIVENIAAVNGGHAIRIQCQIREGASGFAMLFDQAMAANVYWCENSKHTMRTNEYLRCYFLACTAGDVIQLWIHGRQIKTGLYL